MESEVTPQSPPVEKKDFKKILLVSGIFGILALGIFSAVVINTFNKAPQTATVTQVEQSEAKSVKRPRITPSPSPTYSPDYDNVLKYIDRNFEKEQIESNGVE